MRRSSVAWLLGICILGGWQTAQAKDAREAIKSLQRRIERARPGGVVRLPRGQLVGHIRITKPLTLRGAGQKKTFIQSTGKRAVLMIESTAGNRVKVENMTFTSHERALDRRGVAVMISGPGSVELRNVSIVRAIAGRCIGSAISLQRSPRLRLENVEVKGHHCYLAGAMVIPSGAEVEIVNSSFKSNEGQLAGAILVTGGKLSMERTIFDANRFRRGRDGHHLVVGPGRSELKMSRVQFKTDRRYSIAFEKGASPRIELSGMTWPEAVQPKFVQRMARR